LWTALSKAIPRLKIRRTNKIQYRFWRNHHQILENYPEIQDLLYFRHPFRVGFQQCVIALRYPEYLLQVYVDTHFPPPNDLPAAPFARAGGSYRTAITISAQIKLHFRRGVSQKASRLCVFRV
jgi:hypothetical protein